MLNIAQCREILGEDCELTDAEVERLRDFVYALADVTLRIAQEEQARGRVWCSASNSWVKR